MYDLVTFYLCFIFVGCIKSMIKRLMGRTWLAEISRFLMTGGLNTVLTLLVYQLAVTFVSATVAYAIAWGLGFLFVCIAYPKFVFRSDDSSLTKAIPLLFFYLTSFLIGLFLTSLFVGYGVNGRLSIFIVIFLTSALNFIAGKFLYGKKG